MISALGFYFCIEVDFGILSFLVVSGKSVFLRLFNILVFFCAISFCYSSWPSGCCERVLFLFWNIFYFAPQNRHFSHFLILVRSTDFGNFDFFARNSELNLLLTPKPSISKSRMRQNHSILARAPGTIIPCGFWCLRDIYEVRNLRMFLVGPNRSIFFKISLKMIMLYM